MGTCDACYLLFNVGSGHVQFSLDALRGIRRQLPSLPRGRQRLEDTASMEPRRWPARGWRTGPSSRRLGLRRFSFEADRDEHDITTIENWSRGASMSCTAWSTSDSTLGPSGSRTLMEHPSPWLAGITPDRRPQHRRKRYIRPAITEAPLAASGPCQSTCGSMLAAIAVSARALCVRNAVYGPYDIVPSACACAMTGWYP